MFVCLKFSCHEFSFVISVKCKCRIRNGVGSVLPLYVFLRKGRARCDPFESPALLAMSQPGMIPRRAAPLPLFLHSPTTFDFHTLMNPSSISCFLELLIKKLNSYSYLDIIITYLVGIDLMYAFVSSNKHC